MESYRCSNSTIWLISTMLFIISLMAVGCGSDSTKPTTEPVRGDLPLMRLIIENQTEQVNHHY